MEGRDPRKRPRDTTSGSSGGSSASGSRGGGSASGSRGGGSASGSRGGGSASGSRGGGPPPSPKRVTVQMADMSREKLEEVVEHVTEGFKEYGTDTQVAQSVTWKLELFGNGKESWHCIIGNFSYEF